MSEIGFPLNLKGVFMDEKMRPELEKLVAEYLFEEIRLEKKMTVDAMALKVWPEQKVESSRMKIHRFLKPQGNGKPKNMYLFDFLHFCDALNEDPIRALMRILDKLEAAKKTEMSEE